jgi:hypothetical protein
MLQERNRAGKTIYTLSGLLSEIVRPSKSEITQGFKDAGFTVIKVGGDG